MFSSYLNRVLGNVFQLSETSINSYDISFMYKLPWYNCNIVECGIKHHQPNLLFTKTYTYNCFVKKNTFLPYFPYFSYIFTIFYCIFQIFSLFDFNLPFFHIFHSTLVSSVFSISFPYSTWLSSIFFISFTFQLTFLPYFPYQLIWQLFYLFCSSIVVNTVIVTAGNFEP